MDWSMVGTILTLISFVIVSATAYLRLFVLNQLSLLKDEIKEAVRNNYPTREVFEIKFNELSVRIKSLEEIVRE